MYLQCPFKSWWQARKVFRMPRFSFYCGPLHKCEGVYYQFGNNESRKEAGKMLDDYQLKKFIKMTVIITVIMAFFILVVNNMALTLLSMLLCGCYLVMTIFDIVDLELVPVSIKIDKPFLKYEQKGFIYFVSTEYLKWHKFPITITSRDVGWKTKWNEVRYENPGFFSIIFGKNVYTAYQICMSVYSPKSELEHLNKNTTFRDMIYWEMLLTYLYVDKDIEKAKKRLSSTWGGSDGEETPSWETSFLKKKYR